MRLLVYCSDISAYIFNSIDVERIVYLGQCCFNDEKVVNENCEISLTQRLGGTVISTLPSPYANRWPQ